VAAQLRRAPSHAAGLKPREGTPEDHAVAQRMRIAGALSHAALGAAAAKGKRKAGRCPCVLLAYVFVAPLNPP